MFVHEHPYEIFIPEGCEKVIVGTLPPPRLSTGELRERDVDFCYGSCDNLLWPCLAEIYGVAFLYNNSREAVEQRKRFLRDQKTGICDIVESCFRKKINASDLGMSGVRLRNIFQQLHIHPSIRVLLFTGGNSKNGPEFFFRKQAKELGISLELVKNEQPKYHQFVFGGRRYLTISLISPSNAANRAVGSTEVYKRRKREQPGYSTFIYRVEQYRAVFTASVDQLFPSG